MLDEVQLKPKVSCFPTHGRQLTQSSRAEVLKVCIGMVGTRLSGEYQQRQLRAEL